MPGKAADHSVPLPGRCSGVVVSILLRSQRSGCLLFYPVCDAAMKRPSVLAGEHGAKTPSGEIKPMSVPTTSPWHADPVVGKDGNMRITKHRPTDPIVEPATLDRLWIELVAAVRNDDGAAAKEHLAAGRAVYYSEDDTPDELLIKEYPDGRRELVRFDEAGDEVVRTL